MTSANIFATPRALAAFRVVQWATLAALAWKIGAFIAMLRTYYRNPLHIEFFPEWLESPTLLAITYVIALMSLTCNALLQHSRWRFWSTVLTLLCMMLLCLHQGSYNDATFTTGWWTALWSVWMANRLGLATDERLLGRAAFSSRCIVSLIFLGGAVGKWTAEYWSGQVFYEIYFLDRDFWFFNLLRSSLDADQLRVAATWYSRMVIFIESLCGIGLWLLPSRWAAVTAVVVLCSIALFSNFNLFSVVLSIIGLAAVGIFIPASKNSKPLV